MLLTLGVRVESVNVEYSIVEIVATVIVKLPENSKNQILETSFIHKKSLCNKPASALSHTVQKFFVYICRALFTLWVSLHPSTLILTGFVFGTVIYSGEKMVEWGFDEDS